MEILTFASYYFAMIPMRQLLKTLVIFFFAIIAVDAAYAQSEKKVITGSAQVDTCASFIKGREYYEDGITCFNFGWYKQGEDYLKKGIRCLERHLEEHPQHDSTSIYLGYSYTLFSCFQLYFFDETTSDDLVKNIEKALNYLPEENEKERIILHYVLGDYYLSKVLLSGSEPDYCRAFEEYDKAVRVDIDFNASQELETPPELLDFVPDIKYVFFTVYKEILYKHAYLLFLSHYYHTQENKSIGGLSDWDACVGEGQLDRCFNELNRLVNIGQEDYQRNIFDNLALMLLGGCYYFYGEFAKATECYEKSGLSPDEIDMFVIGLFYDAYLKQGNLDEKEEQITNLARAISEGFRNNPNLYRLLYSGEENEQSLSSMILFFIYNNEFDKALDLWFKIRNNFSLNYDLLFFQACCKIYLGEFSATSDIAYAYHMYYDYLKQSPQSSIETSDDDVFIQSIDSLISEYSRSGIRACFYEKDYEFVKDYYENLANPNSDDLLMLALCYQKLAEQESNPTTKKNLSVTAEKIFREVVDMENPNTKPYALLFLGETDQAVDAINFIDRLLEIGFFSLDNSLEDSIMRYDFHSMAANIFATVGELEIAEQHFTKALRFYHDPWTLAFALKEPLLEPIHEYVEMEVEQYKRELGISESPIHRDTIICDIPFRKRTGDHTRTISCSINGIEFNKMLFDPGANYVQITEEMADRIGITKNDIIGTLEFDLADGSTVKGNLVSLKEVKLGSIVLENVQAVIGNTPLIGCTVWNNLKVEMPSPENKWMIRLTYIKESIETPHTETSSTSKTNENLW